jgi:hypothetical protein
MTLPQRLSILACCLPLLSIAISYGLTVEGGYKPWCIPWLDGCTTITATGVFYPAAYVMRAGLISTAMFCFVWWYCASIWLQSSKANPLKGWMYSLIVSSMFGSLMLIVSIAVLGEHMEPRSRHQWLWRLHTITAGLFFLLTSVCQIIMTIYMHRLREALNITGRQILLKTLLAAGQLASMVAYVILLQTDMDSRKAEAICEWWLASFCCLYFITGYGDWADFRLTRREQQQASMLAETEA